MPDTDKQDRLPDFKAIVVTFQEKVRGICCRYVRSPEDADDIAQEVFIQVYGSLSRFRSEAELSTWIYRIAVNKSLDFLRRSKRKKRFAQLVSIFSGKAEVASLADSRSPDPHQELERKERRELLDRAVGRLPEQQKTAVILSRYEGLSNRETAEVMKLSVPAVEALLHRAKSNLIRDLTDFFEKNG